jgi:hypothetical protein
VRSKHLLVLAIVFQLLLANGTAIAGWFMASPVMALPAIACCCVCCIIHLRQLPECVQLSRVLDAGEFCRQTNYSQEAVELFWRENNKLESMMLK